MEYEGKYKVQTLSYFIWSTNKTLEEIYFFKESKKQHETNFENNLLIFLLLFFLLAETAIYYLKDNLKLKCFTFFLIIASFSIQSASCFFQPE